MAVPLVSINPDSLQDRRSSLLGQFRQTRGQQPVNNIPVPSPQLQSHMQPSQESHASRGESPIGFLARTGARTVARAGEEAFGLPGNLLELGLGVGDWATGGIIPSYEKVQEALPVSFPTSGQIREKGTKRLTGEYLEPQGAGERFWDDLVGETTNLLIPSGLGAIKTAAKGAKLALPGLKASAKFLLPKAGLAAGALGAERATTALTGSEGLGQVAKIGTYVLATVAGGSRALRRKAEGDLNSAERIAKTQDIRGESTKLSGEMNTIGKNADKKLGLGSKDESFFEQLINKVKKHIRPEQEISPEDLVGKPKPNESFFAPSTEAGAVEINKPRTQITQPQLFGPNGELIKPGISTVQPVNRIAEEVQKSRVFFKDGKLFLPEQMTANDAIDLLHGVNSYWPQSTKAERTILRQMNGALNGFIKDIGKGHPEFLQNFESGQTLWKALQDAPEWLQNLRQNTSFQNAMKNYKVLGAGSWIIHNMFGPSGVTKAALGAGTAVAARSAADFAHLYFKYPQAQAFLNNFYVNAAKNNGPGAARALKGLIKFANKVS